MTWNVCQARAPEAVRWILESLPAWFGDSDSINEYVRDAGDERFTSLTVDDGSTVLGVALLNRHFPESAELHLIAVAPQTHRTGAGSELFSAAEELLIVDGCQTLTVHTVGPSFPSPEYERTRRFYTANGFMPLEEHIGLDGDGPTVIMAKSLEETSD
ncbi:GNAT family N-acetyltransferase [Arthrobacter rhombi]|uniref:GNAT family N-acetyltransferase n=1 Tax=Arthrobacter rhombi TaxID=71253 RepID=UPI003FD4796A